MSNSATPWTVVHKPLMSMGFFRQEYWGTLPFLPPGDFFYHLRHQEKPLFRIFLYSSLESVFFRLSNICLNTWVPALAPYLLNLPVYILLCASKGFPGSSVVKNLPTKAGGAGDVYFIPGSGRSPGRGHGNPLQFFFFFLPGKSHKQRNLVGYKSMCNKELDSTEQHTHQHTNTHTGASNTDCYTWHRSKRNKERKKKTSESVLQNVFSWGCHSRIT